VIYACGDTDDGGLVDYVGFGILILTESELDLGVEIKYVGEGSAEEYQELVLYMAVLNTVKEEGLYKDLIALVELGAGDLAGAAEVGLRLNYEIFGIAFCYNFVIFLGELEYQLAILAVGLGFLGEDVLCACGFIGLSRSEIKLLFFAHDQIPF